MLQRSIRAIAVMIGLGLGATAAEAGKLPIPCTGERIVKVMALPDKPEFTTPRGQHIDLGYLYQGCSGGKWIGYIGSSSQYVTWKDGALPAIMATAGIGAVPAEPSFIGGLFRAPLQFWGEWVWIVILGCIGFVTLFSGAKTEEANAVTPPAEPVTPSARATGADQPIRRVARTLGPSGAPTSAPPAAPPRMPRVLGAGRPASSPGFGRRG